MAQQPSRDDVLTISVTGYHEEPGPESGPGEGLVLETTRGDIHCLIHPAPESTELAVVWVVGARGGFRGPADGNLYAPLAEQFRGQGIVSLRPSYRQPNHLDECVLDALAAVSLLRQGLNVRRVAIVGHSFGGAVAISAARYSDTICAVASLSGQTYGAKDAVLVAPRPLLIVHGEDDTVLPVESAEIIYSWAFEPKEKVIYPGAGHGLRECRDDVYGLLSEWLVRQLRQGS